MNLEEQLKLATSSVAQPAQAVQPVQVAMPVVDTNVQAVAQVVQPTQTVAMPVQPVVATTQTMDLDKAQAETISNFGVQTIQLGQTISTRSIEPVKKLEKGESIRITLVEPSIQAAKIHVHPVLGKVNCFSTDTSLGQCCQELGDPKVRYFMPVLVYSTMPNDAKTPLPQGKSELRLLVLWDTGSYNQLCTEIMDAGGDTTIDLVATSEDSFGKLSFRGQRDSFRAMPEYQRVLVEAQQKWAAIKDRAADTVRRNIDPVRYAQLSRTAQVPQTQDYTMSDVM
jgi:hypothetical protein